MDKIRAFLDSVNGFVGKFIEPILNKIANFIQSGKNAALAIILVFLALTVLIGLFTWLKKTPKLFFFVLIVFGGLAAAALLI
ncbi:MAG: hypothetical protein GX661_02450 [Acholeplasmataceae bacterium]|nr:hypothetical protein [Acholeplasmataceae bacterium]